LVLHLWKENSNFNQQCRLVSLPRNSIHKWACPSAWGTVVVKISLIFKQTSRLVFYDLRGGSATSDRRFAHGGSTMIRLLHTSTSCLVSRYFHCLFRKLTWFTRSNLCPNNECLKDSKSKVITSIPIFWRSVHQRHRTAARDLLVVLSLTTTSRTFIASMHIDNDVLLSGPLHYRERIR
jgi:hypothetical protein